MSSTESLFRRLRLAVCAGVTLVVFFCFLGEARGQCPACIPFGDPDESDIPTIIVGSPSGLLGAYSFTLRDGNANPVHEEAWISMGALDCAQGTVLFTEPDSTEADGTILVCGTSCTGWAYLGKNTASDGSVTFSYPRFGGYGTLDIQHELDCPCRWSGTCIYAGYVGVACVQARSTDFNADGNTDQNDKLAIGVALTLAPSSRPIHMDLTLDGDVDAADYRVVANEMVIEWNNGSIIPLLRCPAVCSNPPCPLQRVYNEAHFVNDASPPGRTALSVSVAGGNATLTWNSPGDHDNNGTQQGVAKEFDIRYSANPITSANFAAATPLTGEPQPDLPGTIHTMVVPAANYFAIRTLDWSGNASPVCATPLGPITLNAGGGCYNHVFLSWFAPGDATAYDIRWSNSVITSANFTSATQIPTPPTPSPPASPGTLEEIMVNVPQCSAKRYYAIKFKDGCNNWSPMSNVPSAKPVCPTPPIMCDDGKIQPETPIVTPTTTVLSLDVPVTYDGDEPVRVDFAVPAELAGAAYDLDVFDVTGRRIAEVASGVAVAGNQSVTWDRSQQSGRRLAAGVYIVRLQVGSETITRRIVTIH